MNVIFFLTRLPFFLIGFSLFTLFVLFAGGLGAIYWLLIVPLVWVFLLVPFNFLLASFQNSSEVFKSYIEGSVEDWMKTIKERIKSCWETYSSLGSWLLHGSK